MARRGARVTPAWGASLRTRVATALLVVAVAPLAVVWASSLDDGRSALLARASRAARDAAAVLERPPADPSAIDRALGRIAAERSARIRVVDGSGAILADHDESEREGWWDRLGDAFFGPAGAPTLRDAERTEGPAGGRAEVTGAMREGRATGCARTLGDALLVCHDAERASDPRRGALVVYAQTATPRAIRALYAVRFPVLKLTLLVLASAAALAWWLGRRIARPIEALRDAALARANAPLDAPPVEVNGRDEVADLARAFNALTAALASRSRANQSLAADLAHELKNPVATVRACAEALGEGAALDRDRTERLARALGASSERLEALVDRFLELARAEAGLPGEARERVDLAALVRALRDALTADERHTGVRLELELDGGALVVEGVAGRLEGALRNVLENAASFAGAGGWVRVGARALEDGAVEVRVTDSGAGIAPEDLPRVFDRFFTTRAERRGTGLGLAMSRAVAEAHGGTLTAQSPPGEGATFVLRVPSAASR